MKGGRMNNRFKEMPFWDHLEELRNRILKSIGTLFLFSFASFPLTGIVLNWLTMPNTRLSNPAKLVYLKPTGMLLVRMEIALACGIILASPVIVYQIWQFISPALHDREKRFVLPTVFFTTLSFLLGGAFAYFVMIPVMLPFMLSMGTETIEAMINITEYLSFMLRLILVSGLSFEFPIIFYFLGRLGLITPKFLRKYRKHSIVIIFIFSAVATPTTDPVNQIILALPLLLLYEVSIFLCKLGNLKHRAE
jgi:sec-independent protein translocase protein TatC